MTDVHRLPDEREVTRAASEWHARLHADDVTAEDRARFDAWRSAHPMHARVFDNVAHTWGRFAAAGPLVRAVAFAQSINEVAIVAPSKDAVARSNAHRWRQSWFAAAAAIVAAAVVGFGWVAYHRGNPGTTYKTAIGEHSTVSLPDGSSLELNSDSRARVDYAKRYRVVHLKRGEAFFKVAHDTQRPFWVVGGGSWVRAVGTAFNVDLRATGVRVTVSEGTVKVGVVDPLQDRAVFDDKLLASAPLISILAAGQEADVHAGAADTRQLSVAQIQRSTGWRTGTLYFENQPLSEVIEDLKRYTSLDLVVEDEELRRLPVGGTFQASPQGADAFLAMLSQGLGLYVQREPGRVVITRSR